MWTHRIHNPRIDDGSLSHRSAAVMPAARGTFLRTEDNAPCYLLYQRNKDNNSDLVSTLTHQDVDQSLYVKVACEFDCLAATPAV